MAWYVRDSDLLDEDWNTALRQAGFFRTNYTYQGLEYFLKKLKNSPELFKADTDLKDSVPSDVYLELAKAGLLSNTRKTNLLKKLIEDQLK